MKKSPVPPFEYIRAISSPMSFLIVKYLCAQRTAVGLSSIYDYLKIHLPKVDRSSVSRATSRLISEGFIKIEGRKKRTGNRFSIINYETAKMIQTITIRAESRMVDYD